MSLLSHSGLKGSERQGTEERFGRSKISSTDLKACSKASSWMARARTRLTKQIGKQSTCAMENATLAKVSHN